MVQTNPTAPRLAPANVRGLATTRRTGRDRCWIVSRGGRTARSPLSLGHGLSRDRVTKMWVLMWEQTRQPRGNASPSNRLQPGTGGGRGIRTPDTLSGTTVFKTAAINHSAIPPVRFLNFSGSARPSVTVEAETRGRVRITPDTAPYEFSRISGVHRHNRKAAKARSREG